MARFAAERSSFFPRSPFAEVCTTEIHARPPIAIATAAEIAAARRGSRRTQRATRPGSDRPRGDRPSRDAGLEVLGERERAAVAAAPVALHRGRDDDGEVARDGGVQRARAARPAARIAR
jgi:hypothetical protein